MVETISKFSNMHAMILLILGVVLMAVGVGIITIHNPLRGSGLGTISLVIGIVLLLIGILRFLIKPKH